MIIPLTDIQPDTLNAIIKEFVLTEGTEYGIHDISMDEKIAQVVQQLKNETAYIVYSELHESVNIVPAEQFNQNVDTNADELA